MRYPVVIEHDGGAWGASVPDMPGAFAVGKNRAELIDNVREAMYAYAEELRREGRVPDSPGTNPIPELEDGESIEYLEPAEPDPISAAISKAIAQSGLSKVEVARRMGIPASVVSRLTDPMYRGHSADSLRRVAEALGVQLDVTFRPPSAPPLPTRHGEA